MAPLRVAERALDDEVADERDVARVRHRDVQPPARRGDVEQPAQHRVRVDQVLQHVVTADRVERRREMVQLGLGGAHRDLVVERRGRPRPPPAASRSRRARSRPRRAARGRPRPPRSPRRAPGPAVAAGPRPGRDGRSRSSRSASAGPAPVRRSRRGSVRVAAPPRHRVGELARHGAGAPCDGHEDRERQQRRGDRGETRHERHERGRDRGGEARAGTPSSGRRSDRARSRSSSAVTARTDSPATAAIAAPVASDGGISSAPRPSTVTSAPRFIATSARCRWIDTSPNPQTCVRNAGISTKHCSWSTPALGRNCSPPRITTIGSAAIAITRTSAIDTTREASARRCSA